MRRSATNHSFCFGPDCDNLAGFLIDRNDRCFVDHDSPSPNVDEGIGGPEINAYVLREIAKEIVEHPTEFSIINYQSNFNYSIFKIDNWGIENLLKIGH